MLARLLWVIAMVTAGASLAASLLLLAWVTSSNRGEIERSQRALSYICSTTSVLDALVVAAADQIDANLENGTYAKLARQGVINRENIEAARVTLTKYRAAHEKLTANGACKEVTK